MPLGTGPCSALEAPAANRAAIQEASANFFIDGVLPVTNYLLGCERAQRQQRKPRQVLLQSGVIGLTIR